MKDRVRKDARRAAIAPETENSGISVGHARRVASHHAVLYIIGGPTPTQKAQERSPSLRDTGIKSKKKGERCKEFKSQRRRSQQAGRIAEDLGMWRRSLSAGKRGGMYSAGFQGDFSDFFERFSFCCSPFRRWNVFSRWSYREMQPYQTRMQGILEPVKMGPPMMQSRTQNA